MFRRLFWFIVGAGVAVFVLHQGSGYMSRRQVRRRSVNELPISASGVSESARGFVDRLRAGMAERETELRESLGLPDEPTSPLASSRFTAKEHRHENRRDSAPLPGFLRIA